LGNRFGQPLWATALGNRFGHDLRGTRNRRVQAGHPRSSDLPSWGTRWPPKMRPKRVPSPGGASPMDTERSRKKCRLGTYCAESRESMRVRDGYDGKRKDLPRTYSPISSTFWTCQPEMSATKSGSKANIPNISVTCRVFHALTSAENAVAPKMTQTVRGQCQSSKYADHLPRTTSFGAPHLPVNIRFMSVAREVSHADTSPLLGC
jgi:hypothetical protein